VFYFWDGQTAAMRVIVTGVPGSGKSTLAVPLAAELGLRYVSKDLIKEAMWDALGPGDLEWSKTLGAASSDALLAIAAASYDVLIDHALAARFVEEWRTVPGWIEVRCSCPSDVSLERYTERRRHPSHFDADRRADYDDWFRADATRPPLGPRLEVDTSAPVDVARVADWVRANAR
jgi:adenylate kinase family enzyme